jgi:UDP-N-acetylmuramate--alanine ligase
VFRGKVKTVHFVGIGGIGMSGIAEVLLTLGYRVTGSDLKDGPSVARLRGLGAVVAIGQSAENIGAADVVVRSTAVSEDNPEVAAAITRGVPVIRRAEMLAELMRLKYGVAIGGSHGKTTTTSMVATVLQKAGLDPTIVVGGRLDSLGSNARLGAGDYLVAEADESDGTFLLLSPTIAAITNIDPEHLDHYGDVEALERTFLEFANRVPFYGATVLCVDHPVVQRLVPHVRRRVITYGTARHADLRAAGVRADGLRLTFDVLRGDERLGEVSLGMPGAHNALNALAAVAIGLELSIPFATIRAALDGFTGVQRRFTVRGEAGGVLVVDDYGHHPVEIDATLRAAEGGFPGRRVIAVFQPHRYSRLESLWDDFCGAFSRADQVLVCPVYAAGEAARPGIDHEQVAASMLARGHRGTVAVASLEDATAWLEREVRPGDIVITLGAGDVNKVCGALLAARGAA